MQAIVHEAFGAPRHVLVHRDVERPAIGADRVLVRVHAVAVAKGDWLIARGLPYIARPAYGFLRPKAPVAGLEMAGVVEAVGAEVSDLRPGDAVFGWAEGALAELAAASPDRLARKPQGLSFEEAAALPVSGTTALQAVRDAAAVQPGQSVLIIGASGAVGSFAVQISKALGAQVTGVASARNLSMVRELGADAAIDYAKESIGDGGRTFDAIVDLAGNRPIAELRAALAPDGTLVIVGGTGGKATMGFGRTIRAMLLSPFVRQELKALISNPNQADLRTLAELAEAGTVRPRIGATFPLAQAAEAIERVGAGEGHGKTVVRIAPAGSGAVDGGAASADGGAQAHAEAAGGGRFAPPSASDVAQHASRDATRGAAR